MELTDATAMLVNDSLTPDRKQKWADLGSGSGTFTKALAALLLPQSIIYAMDSDRSVLQKMPAAHNGVLIETMAANFEKSDLPFSSLDGILMANSLHYVKDKPSFLKKIIPCLAPNACILVVEYDTDKSNPWVPYPLNFDKLVTLFAGAGFRSVRKLQERPSLFGRSKLYAAIVNR